MSIELFDPTQVIYGGRPARGFKITCRCGRIEKIHMNSLQGKGETDGERTDAMVTRKFQDMHWFIGKTPGKHRCPACVKAAQPAKLGDKLQEALVKTAVPAPKPP